jgi:hypothetical protein
MGIFRRIFRGNHKKLSFLAGLTLAVLAVVGSAGLAVNRVSASGADCDNNALIKCGFGTAGDFINKVNANDSGNGHQDLQMIYSYYGLSGSDYSNFASHAVAGDALANGNIVVNGQVVATGAKSIGRLASYQGPGYFKQVIGNTSYYGNDNGKTFASGTTSIPVFVLFDDNGNMQFAVMKSCGNVTFGNKVNTGASCSALNKTPVAGKLNTYSFTASAAATGNASIKTYVYDFGDGTPTKTMTDGSVPVEHTYTKGGTFTATVTVYASIPGNSNLRLPAVSMCAKQITVQLPTYNCVQLVGAVLDKSKFQYGFTVTANAANGATFTSVDFDFGDGKSQTGVKPANATGATVTHAYAAAGSYNAAATLHFNVSGADVTAPTCKALVTPETVTPECKPGVPVGSPACTPCQYDTSLPSNSSQCVPPPPLPNTGAGNTIAIFAVVIIAGFLVYRQLLFRKHKAAFAAAEQGTSPLPLGDPLSSDAPLAGTPLAAKKRSLRNFRRRQF